MSHKQSWHRLADKKAWDECPLWENIKKKKQKGLKTISELNKEKGYESHAESIIKRKYT